MSTGGRQVVKIGQKMVNVFIECPLSSNPTISFSIFIHFSQLENTHQNQPPVLQKPYFKLLCKSWHQQRKHSLHGTVVSKTQMLGQKNLAVLLSFVPFVSKCWSLHAAVLKTLSNGPSHNSNEQQKKPQMNSPHCIHPVLLFSKIKR